MGRNGSGKTTLLKCIAQLLKPSSGQIHWHQTDLQTQSREELKKLIAFVPSATTPTFPFTVHEMVTMGRYSLSYKPEAISNAIQFVEMQSYAQTPITQLSSGELQRALLARALAAETPILLLDEPTNFLDLHFKDKIYSYLNQLKTHKLILTATHDLDLASHADELLILKNGKIAYQGKPLDTASIKQCIKND